MMDDIAYLFLGGRAQFRLRAMEYALYKLGLRRRLLRLLNFRNWLHRRRLARSLPQPDRLIRDHLSRLHTVGCICVNTLVDDSIELQETVSSRLDPALLEEIAATIHTQTRPFMKGALNARDLTQGSIFLRYATQPRVIELVTRYIGEYPYLASLELQVSMNHSGCNPQPISA